MFKSVYPSISKMLWQPRIELVIEKLLILIFSQFSKLNILYMAYEKSNLSISKLFKFIVILLK